MYPNYDPEAKHCTEFVLILLNVCNCCLENKAKEQ